MSPRASSRCCRISSPVVPAAPSMKMLGLIAVFSICFRICFRRGFRRTALLDLLNPRPLADFPYESRDFFARSHSRKPCPTHQTPEFTGAHALREDAMDQIDINKLSRGNFRSIPSPTTTCQLTSTDARRTGTVLVLCSCLRRDRDRGGGRGQHHRDGRAASRSVRTSAVPPECRHDGAQIAGHRTTGNSGRGFWQCPLP